MAPGRTSVIQPLRRNLPVTWVSDYDNRPGGAVEAVEEEPEEDGHLVEQVDRNGNVALRTGVRLSSTMRKNSTANLRPCPRDHFTSLVPNQSVARRRNCRGRCHSLALDDERSDARRLRGDCRIGFEYKALLTRVKDRMGTGDWLRGQTEHCVLAVLGDRVFLNGSHTPVIHAGRKEHWQKPEDYYVLVEETYP
jgi:hypothetical protein